MFCGVWDHLKSKLKDKKYKQKTSLKSYKTEINIHANPGLAYCPLNNRALRRAVFKKQYKLHPANQQCNKPIISHDETLQQVPNNSHVTKSWLLWFYTWFYMQSAARICNHDNQTQLCNNKTNLNNILLWHAIRNSNGFWKITYKGRIILSKHLLATM